MLGGLPCFCCISHFTVISLVHITYYALQNLNYLFLKSHMQQHFKTPSLLPWLLLFLPAFFVLHFSNFVLELSFHLLVICLLPCSIRSGLHVCSSRSYGVYPVCALLFISGLMHFPCVHSQYGLIISIAGFHKDFFFIQEGSLSE